MDTDEPSPPVADSAVWPKLNVLALPSYTAILFGLMAFVILAAVLSSLLPDSKLWWPPLVLGVILLTLRDFLHIPDREARRHRLRLPGPAELISIVDQLCHDTNQPAPQVLVSTRQPILWSFGTFRRRFIAVGEDLGSTLGRYAAGHPPKLKETARAVLAHELAHFTNGDVLRAGLARSLLKVTFLVAAVNFWIAIGLIALVVQVGPEVTQPAFWAELSRRTGLPGLDLMPVRDMLRAQNPQVFDLMAQPAETSVWWYAMNYYAAALLPFIVSAAILYFFVWRKLMRVREFYADARAAQTLSQAGLDGAAAVAAAMDAVGTWLATTVTPAGRLQRVSLAKRRLHALTSSGLLAFRSRGDAPKKALADPLLVFGRPWQIAAWAGVAVLLLELMLRGSLTALYISQPGPHLPLLAASVVFTLWLLPQVCSGVEQRRLLGMAAQMVLIFTAVKLSINFLDALLVGIAWLAGQLGPLGRILDLWVCTLVGGCGETVPTLFEQGFSWPQMVRWHILTPIAYFAFFALPALMAGLLLEARLKRWALTWYPLGSSVRRVFWAIQGIQLALLLLIAVPIGNRLFFPWIYQGWPPAVLLGMMVGLLAALIGGVLFVRTHRRLAGCCAAGNHKIPGAFELGKRCPECGAEQHAWLIASY